MGQEINLSASLRGPVLSPQVRGAARARQHAGRRHLVSATRAVEPVTAIFALWVGQPLLALALRALAIHFAAGHVFLEKQPATRAHFGVAPMVRCFAAGIGTDEDRPATLAPVLPLGHLFANGTLLHDGTSVTNEKAGLLGPAGGVTVQGGGQSTLKNAAGSAWQTAHGPCGIPSMVLPQTLQT